MSGGDSFLHLSGKIWFIVAVLGQWIFAAYVAVFYGGSALRGETDTWKDVLPGGMIAGDPIGNFALAAHLLLAVIIMVGGPIQFIPAIRRKALSFHRWNGKVYMVTVWLTSIFGLYMMATRGTAGGMIMHLGTSSNGILIMVCSAFAWWYAKEVKIPLHRKWAMRLFIVVSGVWFFRVGLMFWIAVNGGVVGFDSETFEGPFLDFWSFGQYLLPLGILEMYFIAQSSQRRFLKVGIAAMLLVVTMGMALGIVVASLGMWFPNM